MKNPCSAAAILAACAAVAAAAVDPIVSQVRAGHSLVVTRESGAVETNALFLAMSPAVKREVAEIEATRVIKAAISAVVADTRASIPETASLSDIEVAGLYLAQMAKPADILALAAPTNTLEYLVGAGMRMDLGAIPEPEPKTEVPEALKLAGAVAAGAAAGAAAKRKAA